MCSLYRTVPETVKIMQKVLSLNHTHHALVLTHPLTQTKDNKPK